MYCIITHIYIHTVFTIYYIKLLHAFSMWKLCLHAYWLVLFADISEQRLLDFTARYRGECWRVSSRSLL